MTEAAERTPIRDLADVWEILHRARTSLRDVVEDGLPSGSRSRIQKVIQHLEKAQSYVGEHLSKEGVGLDKMAGVECLSYPSDMAATREQKGST